MLRGVVSMGLAAGFVGVLVLSGCAVKAAASAKANTGGDVDAEGSVETGSGGAKPGSSSKPTEGDPPAPARPSPQGCAFRCYIAEGPRKLEMAPEDEARITAAFSPTMEQFRLCAGARGFHRRGSPTLNLRFNFQGELADEGHDLTGYFQDPQHSCFEAVPKTTPKLSGPPASAVRCAESCVPEKTPKNPKNPKGPKGPKAAPPPTPTET